MDDENIIDGKQKKKLKLFEGIFSFFGWMLMLGYLIQIIASLIIWIFGLSNIYQKLFMINNMETTIKITLMTVVISIVVFIIMLTWGKYNYNRYAHLRRRKFPKDVTQEDVAEYFNLPFDEIKKMQNDKRIELEKTIV
jgi:poly-beta-1,6-N-acetyl-D-glucosamine biosynthesis protein PgaD